MLFNSLEFIVFLPTVFLLILRAKYQAMTKKRFFVLGLKKLQFDLDISFKNIFIYTLT